MTSPVNTIQTKRRSERIKMLCREKEKQQNLPTVSEKARGKKVYKKKKKRKASKNAHNSRGFQHKEREIEVIKNCLEEKGKIYVVLKMKNRENLEKILFEKLNDGEKYLVTKYLIEERDSHSYTPNNQDSTRDVSATEDMPVHSSNQDQSFSKICPKSVKKNIDSFKEQQKLCLQRKDFISDLNSHSVDVKFPIS